MTGEAGNKRENGFTEKRKKKNIKYAQKINFRPRSIHDGKVLQRNFHAQFIIIHAQFIKFCTQHRTQKFGNQSIGRKKETQSA